MDSAPPASSCSRSLGTQAGSVRWVWRRKRRKLHPARACGPEGLGHRRGNFFEHPRSRRKTSFSYLRSPGRYPGEPGSPGSLRSRGVRRRPSHSRSAADGRNPPAACRSFPGAQESGWASEAIWFARSSRKAKHKSFFWETSGAVRGVLTARKVFASAQTRNIKILRGTDPLDFPSEQRHVGSYGFSIASTIDPIFPAEHLKSLIRSPGVGLQPFGRQIGLFPFLRNQLWLRLRKRHVFLLPSGFN